MPSKRHFFMLLDPISWTLAICVRADERSCVRTLVRVYMCVRECARACGCARDAAHVSVYACALAGAGWRAYMRVCVRVRI